MSRKQVVQQLGQAVRALSSSPALASVPVPSGPKSGILGGVTGSTVPTLDIPLPGYEEVKPAQYSASLPPTSTTSLSNGIRLGCQDVASPVASFAVLVNAGSVYEDASTEGASQLLESMIFKGTANRTHFATVRQAENYGITLSSFAQRETLAFFATGPRDHASAAAELLFDSVSNPAIMDHILDAQKEKISNANDALVRDPAVMASEGVVSVAYSGALARPCFWQGQPISAETLLAYHGAHFNTSNTIVAASGMPMTVAESLSSELLATLPSGPAAERPPSHYVGGGSSEHNTSSAAAVVAFESPGWADMKGAILTTVTGYLLGGGADFSSGGPGKGMHSRLYSQVLAKAGWVNNCTAYNNTFEHTGLFGIMMSTPDVSKGAELVDMLCKQLEILASSTPSSEEVERAKSACEANVLAALEMPTVVSEDIARQILSYGERMRVEEFRKEVQGIDAAAVKAFAQKLVSGKPSGVLVGDQAVMPKFDTVSSRFA